MTQSQLPVTLKMNKTLNVNAEEFGPKRSAPAVAEQRIRDIADNENGQKTFDLYDQMGENIACV